VQHPKLGSSPKIVQSMPACVQSRCSTVHSTWFACWLRGAYVGGVDAVDVDDRVPATSGIGGGEGAGDVTHGGGGASGEAGVTRLLRSERRMGLGT
jgi:hypothetical protein